MMKQNTVTLLLAASMAVTTAIGAEPTTKKQYIEPIKTDTDFKQKMPEAEPAAFDKLVWGGDIRLREVYFDNIPYSLDMQARGGANHFQRYRTRLWGEYHPSEDLYFRGRLLNEFRTYQTPDNDTWNSIDEIVIDNLFVDYKINDLAFRVGRQDLVYGTGKLILDGTPKDGSRSIYFNAAKVSYTGIDDTTVDFLAMYTPSEDELAIHRENRDINGKTSGYYGGSEAGGGVYLKNKSNDEFPFEAYYLVKTQEEEWARPGATKGSGIKHDGNDRHTIGTRLMPKFSDAFDANLEVAYQFGDDISAYMIDALASWHIEAMKEQKVTLGLGWYHISGDDPTSSTDEGWNPLWARWPQYSELYVYAFDPDGAGRWSNVSMPHIDFSISPFKNLKSDLLLGYMFAPEKDSAGGGRNRGLLFTWWNRFTIKEKLFTENDKLSGHVLL
jgi:hypothetical protein